MTSWLAGRLGPVGPASAAWAAAWVAAMAMVAAMPAERLIAARAAPERAW